MLLGSPVSNCHQTSRNISVPSIHFCGISFGSSKFLKYLSSRRNFSELAFQSFKFVQQTTFYPARLGFHRLKSNMSLASKILIRGGRILVWSPEKTATFPVLDILIEGTTISKIEPRIQPGPDTKVIEAAGKTG